MIFNDIFYFSGCLPLPIFQNNKKIANLLFSSSVCFLTLLGGLAGLLSFFGVVWLICIDFWVASLAGFGWFLASFEF